MKYALVTPARNEGAFIGKTLASVVSQTCLPERWVVVDDGSTDKTAEIVEQHARTHPWIELVRRSGDARRNFAGKVHAFSAGLERLRGLEFEVLGNLDADLSFEADYMQFLMERFSEDAALGVAGTPFVESGYDSATDGFEGENHVPGGVQLFRWSCYQDIGGYVGNREGGIDWIAVTTARMKGWKTRSFREKRFNHHRPLGTAERGALRALYSYGQKDYYLGGSPLWELFRIAYRTTRPPIVIGGVALMLGYINAALRRMKRPVSPELMRFHRREQLRKLRAIFKLMLRSKKVDKFDLGRTADGE